MKGTKIMGKAKWHYRYSVVRMFKGMGLSDMEIYVMYRHWKEIYTYLVAFENA